MAFPSVRLIVLAALCSRPASAGRMALNVDEDRGSKQLPFTMLRFSVPPSAEAGSDSSLAQLDAQTSMNLTDVQKAALWKDELEVYSAQEAVQEAWGESTEIYDLQNSKEDRVVKEILQMQVPGLKGATFAVVLGALLQGYEDIPPCPVWMIGGTVRDILAGSKPNDVDCAALCPSKYIRALATRMGWKHDGGGDEQSYFAVGDVHGDNPNYLEGFSIDLVFSNALTPENTVNMLLWSVSQSYLIDPSGRGASDAKHKLLYPGSPPPSLFLPDVVPQWAIWRTWILNSFSAPQHQRHVRYLKMRMRGWQPADELVRFFMADLMVIASMLEGTDPTGPTMMFFGREVPAVPASTLIFLGDKMKGMNPQECAAEIGKLQRVYQEDVGSYLQNPRPQELAGQDPLAKDKLSVKDWHQVFMSLVLMCDKPSDFIQYQAQTSVGIGIACDALRASVQKRLHKQMPAQYQRFVQPQLQFLVPRDARRRLSEVPAMAAKTVTVSRFVVIQRK